MNYERAKMIVDLTLAKVEILKLKADGYSWSCHVDADTRSQLLQTKEEIDAMLIDLRKP